MTYPRETPEWPQIAEAFIHFVHTERPWWINGSEAKGFGDTVSMIDLSEFPGEECEICKKGFGTEKAVVHFLKLGDNHPAGPIIHHYAHVTCISEQ